MSIQLSHFTAAAVFATLVSVVFGITQANDRRQMFLVGVKRFAMFLAGLFVAGWLMWLIRR